MKSDSQLPLDFSAKATVVTPAFAIVAPTATVVCLDVARDRKIASERASVYAAIIKTVEHIRPPSSAQPRRKG